MTTLSQKDRFHELAKILKPLFRPFRLPLSAGALLITGSMLIDLTLPWIAGLIVDEVSSGGNAWRGLYRLTAIFFGLILLKSVFETLQAYVIQTTGFRVVGTLRTELFNRLQRVTIGYHDRNATGRVLTRVINDVKTISEIFSASMSVLGLDVMVVLGTIATMLILDWKLGLAVLASFPAVIYVIFHFGGKLAEAYREVRTRLSAINAFLGENTGALATIQRLGAGKSRSADFERLVESHRDAQLSSLKVFAQVQPWTNVLNGVAMGTLLGLGGYWVVQGRIGLGVLVAFLGYMRNLFQPIRDIVEKYNTVLSAMISAERVALALNEPEEDSSPKLGTLPTRPYGIKFEDVEFKYETRDEAALSGIWLDIQPGERVAVVGKTGSGKSTIARLLLRFYEPQAGRITIGGIPIEEWGLGELRSRIVMVPQEVFLFPGTVRDNLRLGRTDLPDPELEEKCRRVHLWEFIQARGGLDMEIQEGGAGLSMGQKQLLSFARVLTLDPDVVILDEATASLDGISENRVLQGLEELMEGRTSILIAHRLSTLEKCDSVVVLDQGQIVQVGDYQTLKTAVGPFQEFYELYSREH